MADEETRILKGEALGRSAAKGQHLFQAAKPVTGQGPDSETANGHARLHVIRSTGLPDTIPGAFLLQHRVSVRRRAWIPICTGSGRH